MHICALALHNFFKSVLRKKQTTEQKKCVEQKQVIMVHICSTVFSSVTWRQWHIFDVVLLFYNISLKSARMENRNKFPCTKYDYFVFIWHQNSKEPFFDWLQYFSLEPDGMRWSTWIEMNQQFESYFTH